MAEKYFVEGPITPDAIARMIESHARKTDVGAHGLFLGQVRADQHESGRTLSIDYTAYADMAIQQINIAREEVIVKYGLRCLHVLHSIGVVPVGGLSLVVMSSARHRAAAQDGVADLVERIKFDVPIWGKEQCDSGRTVWKAPTQRGVSNSG